jgi:hypothetical protein
MYIYTRAPVFFFTIPRVQSDFRAWSLFLAKKKTIIMKCLNSFIPPDAFMAYSGKLYFNLPNKYVMKAV